MTLIGKVALPPAAAGSQGQRCRQGQGRACEGILHVLLHSNQAQVTMTLSPLLTTHSSTFDGVAVDLDVELVVGIDVVAELGEIVAAVVGQDQAGLGDAARPCR
jgi:hypothetical protein